MKYGKYLKNNQVAKWECYYVDYKKLKKLVSDTIREAEKVFTEATKVGFMPAVAEELSKVIKFSSESKTKLRLQYEELEKQPSGDNANQLIEVCRELQRLHEFMKLNKEGFRKILKKYDKKIKTNLGYGVYKQVEARLASEIIDICFIQENTLKFYVSKHGPLAKEFLNTQSEDVFSMKHKSFSKAFTNTGGIAFFGKIKDWEEASKYHYELQQILVNSFGMVEHP